ncbi:MAG TPA: hypothetical protein VE967_05690 [Gemmatimonadaceae bacterium]|nr:hypothetical protein [Gemmatimonadaceae bacterium]
MIRVLVAGLAALAALQGGAPPQGTVRGVRAAFTIEPETVRVGDPATLKVRITAPAGTRVTFPAAVDSTSGVEPLDPVVVSEETKNGILESTGAYRILAWEVGLPAISLGAIRVEQNGAVQELQLGDPRVFVVSVLPADTALRVPKPSRDIFVILPANWPFWLLIIAGFTVAVIVGVWLQRRSRRTPPPPEPYIRAQRAFGRLTSLDLIGAGEPAKHVAASADIVRDFLASRDNPAAPGLTTAELVNVLEQDKAVPVHRVSDLLGVADAIKFAARPVDAPAAEGLGAEAMAIVTEVHNADVRLARSK